MQKKRRAGSFVLRPDSFYPPHGPFGRSAGSGGSLSKGPDTIPPEQSKAAPPSARPLLWFDSLGRYEPPAVGVAEGALATASASSTPSAFATISLVLSITSGRTDMEVIPHSTSFCVRSG